MHRYVLITPYIMFINTSILLQNIQDAQKVCASDDYSTKMRFTDTFRSPCILYSSMWMVNVWNWMCTRCYMNWICCIKSCTSMDLRPYYCELYRMLKMSVNLTITVQKLGTQILFDHPVYYIHQYVHIIAKYTGCSNSLLIWRLQYKNEVHR